MYNYIRLNLINEYIRNNKVHKFKEQKLKMSQEEENEYCEYFSTPLHYAVRYDCSNEMIQSMICSGLNINATNYFGETPLHYAIYRNDSRIVRLLLENGADAYATHFLGETAISMARKNSEMWGIVRAYSKAIRRWKLIRTYIIAKHAFVQLFTDTLEKMWCPGGDGYHVAKSRFEMNRLIDVS